MIEVAKLVLGCWALIIAGLICTPWIFVKTGIQGVGKMWTDNILQDIEDL